VPGTASRARTNEQSAIFLNLLAPVGVLVITSPL
jgi:hypothetical protein